MKNPLGYKGLKCVDLTNVKHCTVTVNSEIFAKFRENKTPAKGRNTLSFTDAVKSCPSREFATWQVCFNVFRENIIHAKITGFTVL